MIHQVGTKFTILLWCKREVKAIDYKNKCYIIYKGIKYGGPYKEFITFDRFTEGLKRGVIKIC